jgi:hypothetical protein
MRHGERDHLSERNCGFKGPSKRRSRDSVIVKLLLYCFFLLPRIIDFMMYSGYRYYCPR